MFYKALDMFNPHHEALHPALRVIQMIEITTGAIVMIETMTEDGEATRGVGAPHAPARQGGIVLDREALITITAALAHRLRRKEGT